MSERAGSSSSLVTVHLVGGVARITLSSAATRNALSQGLLGELHDALDEALVPGVRVVVLDHVPPVFCAGPAAVAATKRLLWQGRRGGSADEDDDDGDVRAFAAMQVLSDRLFRSADGQEGVQSFVEKRRPAWQADAHGLSDGRSPGQGSAT